MAAKPRRRFYVRSLLAFVAGLAVATAVSSGQTTSPAVAAASSGDRVPRSIGSLAILDAAARPPGDADDIPGVPYGQSPATGHGSSVDDPYDVYAISLKGRQEVIFSITRTSGDGVFVLSLYGTGLGGIHERPPRPTEPDPLGTGGLSYTVPTDGTGFYYVVVHTVSGAGNYRISGPEADDNIPGVGLRAPRGGAFLTTGDASGDAVDVLFVDLTKGQETRFGVYRTEGDAQITIELFGPEAMDVYDASPAPVAKGAPTPGSFQSITHFPMDTDRYYLAIRTVSGSGTLRVTYGDPDDNIPGDLNALSQPLADVRGTVSPDGDLADVYATWLTAGDRYTFRAETDGTTLVAPQMALYGVGSKDMYVDTPLSMTTIGSRVNLLTFVPTTTGQHYLAVKAIVGSGDYRLSRPASPFGLSRDAYSFTNYGGSADEQLFREVFGLGTASLSPQASAYYTNFFRGKYGGGMCYGMAITAGIFYRGVWGPKITSFLSTATAVRDLRRTTTGGGTNDLDEPIERHIAKYFFYQYDPTIFSKSYVFSGGLAGTAAQMVSTKLLAGWSDPYAFGWWGWSGGVGHEVNLTGLAPGWSPGNARLQVYDNNAPNEYRSYVFVNGVVTSNYSNVGTCSLDPISAHEQSSIPVAWGKGAGKSVSVCSAADAQLLHTDSLGRRLGVVEAQELAEIPGGYRVVARTGNVDPDWTEPVTYYLQKNQDYTVRVQVAGTEPYRYDLFHGDMLVELDTTPTAGAAARIQTNLSRYGFTLTSEAVSQPVIARLYREPEPGPDRVVEVSKLALTPGGKLTVNSDAAADVFALLPVGATAEPSLVGSLPLPLPKPPTCSIRLISGSGRARTVTTLSDVALTNGVSHTVTALNWNNLPRSAIFVSSVVGGKQTVLAFHASTARIAETVDQLVARRLVGSAPLGDQMETRMRTSSLSSLRTYLNRLSTRRTISTRTAEMVYAYVKAARSAAR